MASDGNDESMVGVLFQFIPYYGQGDPTNDSTVRAALSTLSAEDIDTRDEYGNTLLLLACTYRCEDLVRIMLNKGADPNAVNSAGACGLHFACYGDTASIVIAKGLLQNGASPEVIETTYGCTPLHYSASSGNVELCKLLLTHGAQINTVDYYNYTCVDYARQANMNEAAIYLQKKLDQQQMQYQYRGAGGFGMGGSPMHGFGMPQQQQYMYGGGGGAGYYGGQHYPPAAQAVARANPDEWSSIMDPGSGCLYYVHATTGETLWEQDWKQRMGMNDQQQPPQQQSNLSSSSSAPVIAAPEATVDAGKKKKKATIDAKQKTDAWLSVQTTKTRLIAFLAKNAPSRLPEVEAIMQQYKGKEQDVIRDMCAQYGISEDSELAAYEAKQQQQGSQANEGESSGGTSASSYVLGAMKSMFGGQKTSAPPASAAASSSTAGGAAGGIASGTIVGRPGSAVGRPGSAARRPGSATPAGNPQGVRGIDAMTLQSMVTEERTKLEAKLIEERNKYRITISEKDGQLSKLSSELLVLQRETQSVEMEMSGAATNLTATAKQGGETVNNLRDELQLQRKQLEYLQSKILTTSQESSQLAGTLAELEATLSTVTAGNEDRIAKENVEAVERESLQRELENKRRAEMKSLEDQKRTRELKVKADLQKIRSEFKKAEEEEMATYTKQRKGMEIEIDSLSRELAERKAKFTKELTAANIDAEHCKKVCEEAVRRMTLAEEMAKSMEAEVAEAKEVQQFNAQMSRDLNREQQTRKKLHNDIEDMKGKIRVYVRMRPLSKSELERQCFEAAIRESKTSVVIKNADGSVAKTFDFDQVFGGRDGNSQVDIFRDTKHLVMSVLDGFNVCIFAYGQTGAGKSYTMIGAADIGNCLKENGDFEESAGITPRAVSELFRLLNERSMQMTYVVEVQMFQLYRDNIDDLLMDRGGGGKKKKKGEEEPVFMGVPLKIVLAEHSSTGLVQVEGAEVLTAETPGDVMRIFARGSARRTTASTQMNAESSRSHLICSLVVKMTNKRSGTVSIGKLTLVDLAGSERVDKSGAAGEVLKEAQSINKSLSALGDVIAALTSGQQHIPYRNHPLTMLMSDSVGGNSKTLIFINTSPADYNVAETTSSLSFGTRCKDITNSVQAGPGVQAAQLNALKKELAKLKKAGGGAASSKQLGGLGRPI